MHLCDHQHTTGESVSVSFFRVWFLLSSGLSYGQNGPSGITLAGGRAFLGNQQLSNCYAMETQILNFILLVNPRNQEIENERL